MESQPVTAPIAMDIPPVPAITDQSQWRTSSPNISSSTSSLAGPPKMSPAIQPLGADSQYKTTRPVSEKPSTENIIRKLSTTSSFNASTFSGASKRSTVRKARNCDEILDRNTDFHWTVVARNPRNWSTVKRWSNTLIPAMVAFTVAFASSIVAPAHQSLLTSYNTSSTAAMLPFSLFVLGLSFGPIFSNLISNIYGRKMVYLTCFLLFSVMLVASSFVGSLYGIIICRLIAGIFAGPCLSVGFPIISDIWRPSEHTLPLIIYNSMLLIGSFVGILVGGFAIQDLSWSWTQWLSLFLCALCTPMLLFLSETSKKTINRRKNKEPKRAPLDPEFVTATFKRPLRMLFKEPIVILQGTYMSFIFAVLYAAFAAWPYVFSQSYVFDVGSQGLVFASMVTGLVVAFLILLANHHLIYKPAVGRFKQMKIEEIEKAMAERRQVHSASRRAESVAWSIRRVTSINRNSTAALTALPQTAEQERNTNISVAAAKHLNEMPANDGKHIAPDRILLMLQKNPTYGDLCDELEENGLKLDRVSLARAIVEGIALLSASASPIVDLPSPRSIQTSSTHGTPMARSKSLHLAASSAFGPTEPLPHPGFAAQFAKYTPPPPEWRLWLTPLSSFLVVGSLFMFGWTARKHDPLVQYFVAISAMGIFAGGATIGLTCATLYIYDVYGQENGACALAGELIHRYLLAATFPLFALQLYATLDTAWATSVFGFIAAALGLAPCVLLVAGRKFRKWSKLLGETEQYH